jgi:hypothetical protein
METQPPSSSSSTTTESQLDSFIYYQELRLKHEQNLNSTAYHNLQILDLSSGGTDGDGGDNIDNANHTTIGFCHIVSLYAFTDETEVAIEEKEEQQRSVVSGYENAVATALAIQHLNLGDG